MLHRVHLWLTRHPMAVELVWCAVLFPFVVSTAAAQLDTPGRPGGGWGMLWGCLYLVPLLWRRTHPDLAALGLLPAHLVQLVVVSEPTLGNATVPIMMYAVAAYGRDRWTRPWLWAGLGASVLAAFDWALFTDAIWQQSPRGNPMLWIPLAVLMALSCGAFVAAAWFMGSLARSRRLSVEALRDRAEALERERDKNVRLAASEERSRIAREMHDVVAHSLSVIVVQADGAAFLAGSPGDPAARLASVEKALETIQGTARTALAETRRLVGVLHSDGDTPELAPQAGIAEVPALVANLASAGRSATFGFSGDPRAHGVLGPGAELAVYRVVQESLTNVIKHAGPGAAVHVQLDHRPDGLTVTVRDDGYGATPSDGLGHGLVGMRERVAAVGGALLARPRPSGGFEVVATFPSTKETDR